MRGDLQAAGSSKSQTFQDRISSQANRLDSVAGQLENVLSRIRGSHPSPVDGSIATNSVPTLQSACAAVERKIDDLETLTRELNETF